MSELGQILWPFLRLTGIFLTAPVYNSAFIPRPVKLAICLAYAVALAMWLPHQPAFPGTPVEIFLQGFAQIAFGALLGLTMQIMLAAIACAGELVGLSIGLGFAELQFREASTAVPVLYDLMFWVGLMAYLAAGGPVWLFAAVAHSFQNGVGVGLVASAGDLAALGAGLVGSAVWLAAPVLAVSLCVNLTVGLATIFAPQLNLLTIGFPLLIIAGLWIFAASCADVARDFAPLLAAARACAQAMAWHV